MHYDYWKMSPFSIQILSDPIVANGVVSFHIIYFVDAASNQ